MRVDGVGKSKEEGIAAKKSFWVPVRHFVVPDKMYSTSKRQVFYPKVVFTLQGLWGNE